MGWCVSPPCGSNLVPASQYFFYHIVRMLTTGTPTRRDATRRHDVAGRGRGRGCGKVRQYERVCPWSVLPAESLEYNFFRPFRCLFVSHRPVSRVGRTACVRVFNSLRTSRIFPANKYKVRGYARNSTLPAVLGRILYDTAFITCICSSWQRFSRDSSASDTRANENVSAVNNKKRTLSVSLERLHSGSARY